MSPKPIKPTLDAKQAQIAKRVRARKSDFASRVETVVGDVLVGKATPGQYGAVMAVLVGILAAGLGLYLVFRSHVVALKPEDTAQLKEVFYSGEPWLVECARAAKASPLLYAAESSLGGIKIGTLDCAKVLPSGKTTYERFKLREPKYGPIILAMANGERPQIAPRNVLSSGAALATWAMSASATKVYTPASTEQFESQCVRKAWCVVVLSSSGRLVDLERNAAQALAAAHRRVRVVKVDTSRFNLLLDLPGGVPPPTSSEASVLLIKRLAPAAATIDGRKDADADADADANDGADSDESSSGPPVAAMVLATGLRDMSATTGTIRATIGTVDDLPNGMSQLVKRPSMRPKRLPPPSTPYRMYNHASPSEPEPAAKTLTDAELKAMRAEREKLIKEAEQQRRQKMAAEEESAANIIEEVGSDDRTDGDALFSEEGDESDASSGAEDMEEVEAEEM